MGRQFCGDSGKAGILDELGPHLWEGTQRCEVQTLGLGLLRASVEGDPLKGIS